MASTRPAAGLPTRIWATIPSMIACHSSEPTRALMPSSASTKARRSRRAMKIKRPLRSRVLNTASSRKASLARGATLRSMASAERNLASNPGNNQESSHPRLAPRNGGARIQIAKGQSRLHQLAIRAAAPAPARAPAAAAIQADSAPMAQWRTT